MKKRIPQLTKVSEPEPRVELILCARDAVLLSKSGQGLNHSVTSNNTRLLTLQSVEIKFNQRKQM